MLGKEADEKKVEAGERVGREKLRVREGEIIEKAYKINGWLLVMTGQSKITGKIKEKVGIKIKN